MPEESAFSFTALGDALVLPRNLCAALDYDFADAVHAATSDPQVSVRSVYHIPHHSSARGNRPGLKLLRLGIKPHDRVRLGVRFAVPDDTIHDGDPIRLRLRSARGRKSQPYGITIVNGIVWRSEEHTSELQSP